MPVISISVVILVGYGSSFKARTYVRAKEALRNKVAELYKNDPQLHALLVAAELDRNSVSMIVDADIEVCHLALSLVSRCSTLKALIYTVAVCQSLWCARKGGGSCVYVARTRVARDRSAQAD